jgi:hypothetical protein
MKLDARTISILKNFATINQSIVVNPGNVIETISPSMTVMARATVLPEFDRPFAIFELPRFLSAVSMFKDPELVLDEKHMLIKDNNQKIRYSYAEASMVLSPEGKKIRLTNPEIEFVLEQDVLQSLLKAQATLGLPEIAVTGDGRRIKVQAMDSKKPDWDTYDVDVGETNDTFQMVFKAENIRIIPGTYKVAITSKGVGRFTTTDDGSEVTYFIAVEHSSSFGE